MLNFTPAPIIAALLFVCTLAPAAVAQDNAAELKAKMLKAYAETKTYDAATTFSVQQVQGRWRLTQSGDFQVVFDRDAGSLLVDKPDVVAAIDKDKLRLKAHDVQGRHLETAAPQSLTAESMAAAMPYLLQPPLLDVQALLGADMVQGALKLVPPEASDAAKRPGIEVRTPEGVATYWLDPATHLISAATLEVGSLAGNTATGPVTVRYDITVQKHNQPLDAGALALDLSDSEAVGSLQELFAGGAAAPHELVGQPAPDFTTETLEGKPYSLREDKAEVIVLEFWATWCVPCIIWLPEVQKVYEWAQAENKSLAVYAVNQQDAPEQVRALLERRNIDLPVLMDPDVEVARLYKMQGLPHTVIIHKGKVAHVHEGLTPGMAQTFRREVEALLGE